MKFENELQMRTWLRNQGVDTSKWGVGSAKTVWQLWQELQAGESSLRSGPMRIIRVVVLIVRRGGTILWEAEQEFQDGRRRIRNKPPREKLKGGEDVLQAAHRCLAEELRVAEVASGCRMLDRESKVQERESASYPGLLTRYIEYSIEVDLPQLPGGTFITEELKSDAHDPVRYHTWKWVTG